MVEFNVERPDDSPEIKEVFKTENIASRTDLNIKQIEANSKGLALGMITYNPLILRFLDQTMILMLSKERKSRNELVNVVQAKRQDLMQQGGSFFNNMLGR